MNCQSCGKPLLAALPGGHQVRVYCNQACKQAHYRKRHAISQTPPSAELQAAMQRIEELERCIEELRLQNIRLQERLDVEKRYLTDAEQRGLKSWLKNHLKKYPSSPLIEKLLADQFFRSRGTRKQYEDFLRNRHRVTEDDLRAFAELWKMMVLQS